MKKECVSNVVHNFLAAVPRVPRLHREIAGGAQGSSSDCRGRNQLGLQPQRSQPSEIVKAVAARKPVVRRRRPANQRLSESTQH